MFGAKMGMEAETHLELIQRLSGDVRSEDLVQPFEGVMIALKPAHTFFDRETGFHGGLYRTDACQSRQIAEGFGRVHTKTVFEKMIPFRQASCITILKGDVLASWP